MNRIDKKFIELKKKNKKAFIAFMTAGDPDLVTTEKLVLAFEKSGVDIVELGVPFSDPLADGPTIQAASQRALSKGVSLKRILNLVSQIRKKSQLPICLMTYYNPVFHFGEQAFVDQALKAGVDGVIIPDLPPEEASALIRASRKTRLATIFFLSPTTNKDRIKIVNQASRGFIYYVSIAGVTGARKILPKVLMQNLKSAKAKVSIPLCVGFGISTQEQVRQLARVCDGVIVGSAIVKEIVKNHGRKDLVERVACFVRSLSSHV
jgi:tryptophan synthase alpha chain